MKIKAQDPRLYQILALSILLGAGVAALGFDVPVRCVAVIFSAALATQYVFTRALRLAAFDPQSAMITSLSLCLLLRADSLAVAALAAVVAIASKFLIRVNGRHVFNPANFAITLFLALHLAWISPAQWGSATWFAFLFVCLGIMVLTRARRMDVTFAFLACYIGLLFARALWLGDPPAIPFRQMQSGALLLFAFFMISDPKTIPSAASGRILYAATVAAAAFMLQYVFYTPKGLMYSLILLSPLTLFIDRWLPGKKHEWVQPANAVST